MQPIDAAHLNRLLTAYREYYNIARPHMHNEGEPPYQSLRAANDGCGESKVRRVTRTPWVGGLHSSYSWAASLDPQIPAYGTSGIRPMVPCVRTVSAPPTINQKYTLPTLLGLMAQSNRAMVCLRNSGLVAFFRAERIFDHHT